MSLTVAVWGAYLALFGKADSSTAGFIGLAVGWGSWPLWNNIREDWDFLFLRSTVPGVSR